jgi:DNA-binding MarR family transcriptional regulator
MRETNELARLLLHANRAVEQVMLQRLEAVWVPGLRMGHLTVLRVLPPHGVARLNELAEAAGVTRQAIAQIVAELAGLGVVEVRVDATDRRARVVGYTDSGRTGYEAAMRAFVGIEADLATSLGQRRLAGLKSALRAVTTSATDLHAKTSRD